MRTFSIAPGAGHQISAFGSHGVTLSPALRTGTLHVVAMYLEPGGLVGRHPAAQSQLLLVVGGSGTVTGADPLRAVTVEPGSAVLWDRDEEHEMRAGSGGLHAIVIEGSVVEDDRSRQIA